MLSLHDEESNNRWLRDWSQKTFLSTEDLDHIRDRFGELLNFNSDAQWNVTHTEFMQVAFYFSFLQPY